MRTRLSAIATLVVACLLCVPENAEARRVYVVKRANGSVEIVDPENTFTKRILRMPLQLVGVKKRSVRKPEGFGKAIKQKDMATPAKPTEAVKNAVGNAVNSTVDNTGNVARRLHSVSGTAIKAAAVAAY